jgi:hypothetical protein
LLKTCKHGHVIVKIEGIEGCVVCINIELMKCELKELHNQMNNSKQ